MARIDGNLSINSAINELDHVYLRLDTTNDPLTGALEIRASVVEQLRVAYDASNYFSFEVDPSGNVQFRVTGTQITFNEDIFTVADINIDSDSKKLYLGDDKDLEVYHTGTAGYLACSTGDLFLSAAGGDVNFSADNIANAGTIAGTTITASTQLVCSAGSNQISMGTPTPTILHAPGGIATATLTLPTSSCSLAAYNLAQTWTAAQTFNDNVKVLLGTGADGELYGSGDAVNLKNVTSNADLILGINDGGVAKTITWDASVDKLKHSAGTFDFDDDHITTSGNITGGNVTSGSDPGHTHTGASLSSIDISDDTNLAVTSPIVLTDDTVSFDFNVANTWTATQTFGTTTEINLRDASQKIYSGSAGNINIDASNAVIIAALVDITGKTKFNDPIGLLTTPDSTSLIKASFSSSAIDKLMEFDFTYTGSGDSIQLFSWVVDFAPAVEAPFSAKGIQGDFVFTPIAGGDTLDIIDIIAYGIKSGSGVGAGTYTITGLTLTPENSASGITGGTFNWYPINVEAAPTGYGSATLNYYSRHNADMWFNADSIGTFYGAVKTDSSIVFDGSNLVLATGAGDVQVADDLEVTGTIKGTRMGVEFRDYASLIDNNFIPRLLLETSNGSFQAPWAGSIIALSCNMAVSADNYDTPPEYEVYIGAGGTGLMVEMDGVNDNYAVQARGLDTFNAGDLIRVRANDWDNTNQTQIGQHMTATVIVIFDT